ncbi:MAG: hypothetical protein ACOY3D_04880 [Candidatus Omnitrophota bacterium]
MTILYIINEINEAHDLAKKKDMVSETLQNTVGKAVASYRNFVDHAREYLGTDLLEPISTKGEYLFKATEETKYS